MKAKTQVIHDGSSQRRIVGQQPTHIFHQIEYHRNHTKNTHHEKKRGQEFLDDVAIQSWQTEWFHATGFKASDSILE